MAILANVETLGTTRKRIWFGALTCSGAKLAAVNAVNGKHQGLGWMGGLPLGHPCLHSVLGSWTLLLILCIFNAPKWVNGTGSQLPAEVPSLMEDSPSPPSVCPLGCPLG